MRPLRRVLLVLAPVELGLVVASAAGLPLPGWLRIAVVLLIASTAALEVALWARAVRRGLAAGLGARRAVREATAELLGPVLGRFVRFEIGLVRGVVRLVTRRPVAPDGAATYSSHRALTPMLVALAAVSVVELAIVHVLLGAWPVARLAALVVGLWGLVWVLGFWAAIATRPHALTHDRLLVRSGVVDGLEIALGDVAAARIHRADGSGRRSGSVESDGADGGRIAYPVAGQLGVLVELRSPRVRGGHDDGPPIASVHLHADDPAALVRGIEQRIRRAAE